MNRIQRFHNHLRNCRRWPGFTLLGCPEVSEHGVNVDSLCRHVDPVRFSVASSEEIDGPEKFLLPGVARRVTGLSEGRRLGTGTPVFRRNVAQENASGARFTSPTSTRLRRRPSRCTQPLFRRIECSSSFESLGTRPFAPAPSTLSVHPASNFPTRHPTPLLPRHLSENIDFRVQDQFSRCRVEVESN